MNNNLPPNHNGRPTNPLLLICLRYPLRLLLTVLLLGTGLWLPLLDKNEHDLKTWSSNGLSTT